MRREKGFTLVELLIVLSIIAALSAVLVPNIPRWTNSAKAGVIESDISQIANAMIQYVDSEGGTIDAGGNNKIVKFSTSKLADYFTKLPENPFSSSGGDIWVKTTKTNLINGAAGKKYGFIMYDHLPKYVADKIQNDLGSDVITEVQQKADGGTIAGSSDWAIEYHIQLNQ